LMSPILFLEGYFFFFKNTARIEGHKQYVKTEYILFASNVYGSTVRIVR